MAIIVCVVFRDTMIIVNTVRAYFIGICVNCPEVENKEINESDFHVIAAMEWGLCKSVFIATPFLEIYKSPRADGNIHTWETLVHIKQNPQLLTLWATTMATTTVAWAVDVEAWAMALA